MAGPALEKPELPLPVLKNPELPVPGRSLFPNPSCRYRVPEARVGTACERAAKPVDVTAIETTGVDIPPLKKPCLMLPAFAKPVFESPALKKPVFQHPNRAGV